MKKALILMICLMALASVICGCSDTTTAGNDEIAQNNLISTSEVDLASFVKPAEAVSVDLSKDDPSTDAMRFVYDNEGKVTQCYYEVGDQQVYVSYSYKGGSVQIYAFMDEVLVADESIVLPDFDAEKGFAAIEGYYFKGYSK